MFEIIRILYKELHYQMLKRNPRLSDESMFKTLGKIGIKRNLVMTSLIYLLFGSFLASGIIVTDNRAVISSLAVTIATLSFVFALYVTVVNSSHMLSIDLFEPLKILPVSGRALYLSELLLLDVVPTLAIAIPSIVVLSTRYFLFGVLLLIWVLIGILIGHTIGLLILSFFGLKISYRKTKGQFLKNLIKIIGLVIFTSAFYGLNYFQKYLMQYSEKFAEVFGRCAAVYPFSASSIFDPVKSSILLIAYTVVFLPLYQYSVNKVWQGILEPKIVFESGTAERFTAGFGGQTLTLAIKDLKLVFRKTSMIAGLLIPLYFILPQIFLATKNGHFPKELVIGLIAIISFFSTVNADIILRIEGKEVDFLKTLPITKSQFILSKTLSTSLVPTISSIIIICLGFYFDRISILSLPYAFLMPINVSMLTMLYLFHYEGEDIGIPEKNLARTFLLLIINGILLGIVLIPVFLIPFPVGVGVSYAIAIIALLAMLIRIFPKLKN